MRESEGRYRALAESTRDIIFILDRQGTLLYANQAASQCIGIPSGEIVGKRQVDLFPPEMARSQIEKIERVFATGEVIEYDDLFHFGPAGGLAANPPYPPSRRSGADNLGDGGVPQHHGSKAGGRGFSGNERHNFSKPRRSPTWASMLLTCHRAYHNFYGSRPDLWHSR